MLRKSRKNRKISAGQVLFEYVVALVVLALVALSCIMLFSVFSEYGENVRKIVGIDSP
ncbi:MAG: hypothetical protein IKB71_01880 [Lentisphaeria bacterium]|nr:hypothetical protein [Lentisphaeria bacterium]